ncbi:MAG: EAL domain-containing protein [Clostridiaceae bacterium]|nr:EAL domain-containing protein [Clostridiaceae bacterium]
MSTIAGSRETSIYIIDDKYRIIHFNRTLQKVFPDVCCGDICYEKLCREKEPCKGCPLTKTENDSAIFFNKIVQEWLEVSTGMIEWPGAGNCNAVFVKEIHAGNKNLLYNLTNISAYDELFELNLTRDSYKILYHTEGKYVIPAKEGRMGEMRTDVADHMIHPEDRERFLEFWNLESVISRIQEENGSHVLKGEFRKRKVDGGYCWVAQTVVPISENEKDDKLIMCFIQDIDEQKKKELEDRRLRDDSYDRFIGLYKRSAFLKRAGSFLKEKAEHTYVMVAIDIEHFKLFNEWYGQDAGDAFLVKIGGFLKDAQEQYGGIAGYMGSDDFCIILPDDADILAGLQNQIMDYVKNYSGNVGFLPAFGVYGIENDSLTTSAMYDRALIALTSVKGNYGKRVCRYDTRMKKTMEENQKLLSEVQRALVNQEFTFYAQPKCNLITGKIIGLESLVRWNHPVRGLIPPGEFIPLLESNGFITNLDIFLWDRVCSSLKQWIDRGHKPVPISVNVSRVDIYTLDVVEHFKKLVETYDLDPRLVEIEITESAYVEESQIIPGVIDNLRNSGFTVLMDDFGSGYSSLNMLKDVNVDVLKIDMKFLEISEQSADKGVGILEAIARMARIMRLDLIAEGVETKEQLDFLLNIGCIYGQGYYYYRPMPIEKFETLLADEDNVDFRGMKAKQVTSLNIKELLNEDVFSQTMINNILGGIAFYDVYEGRVELIQVNEQYYKVTGANPVDLEECRKTIMEQIYKEDRKTVLSIFEEAYKNTLNGAEGDVRRLKNGGMIWMHLRAFFIKEQDGHRLFYGSVSDVTEKMQREQNLESSQKALAAAVTVQEFDNDEAMQKLSERNRREAASVFARITPGGMIGGYCEDQFPLYFATGEMVHLMGYESYQEFVQAVDGKVINTIYPGDRERVIRELGTEYYPGMEYTTMYRMMKKDGSWFWTLDKGKVIRTDEGRLAVVSACKDITEILEMQQQLDGINEMRQG